MGYVEPPTYDENGKRTARVSQYQIKKNCDLGMFVGEEISDMHVDEEGDLVIEIVEEES